MPKIYLFRFLVPPNQPVLGPIRNVEGCTNCIVAQEGPLSDVQCNSTGTFSLIFLQIGDRQPCTLYIDPSGVHNKFTNISACKITSKDHRTQVACLVYSYAEPDGLMSEPITLYVTGTSLKVIKIFVK